MQSLKSYLVNLLSCHARLATDNEENNVSLSAFLQPQTLPEHRVELPTILTSHLALAPLPFVPIVNDDSLTDTCTLLSLYFEAYSWKEKNKAVEEEIHRLVKLASREVPTEVKFESYKLLAFKKGFEYCIAEGGVTLEQVNLVAKDWGGLRKVNKNTMCWEICSSEFSNVPKSNLQAGVSWKEIANSQLIARSRIAAWTKVLAFGNPEHYFIYDSKISLLLNLFQIIIGRADCKFPLLSRYVGKNSARRISQQELLKALNGFSKQVLSSTQSNDKNFYRSYCDLIEAVGEELYHKKVIPQDVPKGLAGQVVEQALFSMGSYLKIC